MKRMFIFLAIFFLAVISAVQARPYKRYDPRSETTRELTFQNLRIGMKLFRDFCKKCHNRKTKNAPFLYPESRTMSAWNNVFQRRYMECAEQGYWNELTEEQLRKINDYLYHEAYDAWDPHDPWDWDTWGFYGW